MNNLMKFENKQVEIINFNGQALFNPKDVAECLDIKNVNENLRSMSEKQVVKLTNSKISSTDFRKLHNTGENFLTESGVYKLIFKSRKAEAERFQDWVTDTVLPSIRKDGEYSTKSKNPKIDNLSPQLQLLINMELKQRQLEETVQETKEDVQAIRDVITLNPNAAWRRESNRILNAIGNKNGDFKRPKENVYNALKERGKCRPNVLVSNLKKRALANGIAPSKVEKLNILDVLENEPRLKEIYMNIVKELAIKENIRL